MPFRPLLALAAGYHVVLGAVMALAPREFFDSIATYGVFNDHYIRDVATFYVAMGAALAVAVVRRSWEVPVLFLCVLQYGLHVLNHLWDVADGSPEWIGPLNVAALALVGVALWWLLRQAASRS